MPFLLSKKVLAASIHQQLVQVYGSDVIMSSQHVAKWSCMFAPGGCSVTGDNLSIGCCSMVMDVSTFCVKELIQMDRHVG
jgi:hypothetical protein